jgi:hypothetical protein
MTTSEPSTHSKRGSSCACRRRAPRQRGTRRPPAAGAQESLAGKAPSLVAKGECCRIRIEARTAQNSCTLVLRTAYVRIRMQHSQSLEKGKVARKARFHNPETTKSTEVRYGKGHVLNARLSPTYYELHAQIVEEARIRRQDTPTPASSTPTFSRRSRLGLGPVAQDAKDR